MYYYTVEDTLCASLSPLPLLEATPDIGEPCHTILVARDGQTSRARYAVTHGATLLGEESVAFLDPDRLPSPKLDGRIEAAMAFGTLTAVNVNHPRWRELISAPKQREKAPFRVHLVAVGDVGSTFVTALKLLGGDCISTIGLLDLNASVVERWVTELGQAHWEGHPMPTVTAISQETLFDCDVVVFAATKAIPAVGSEVQDVRMAQLEANRPLVSHYGKLAREAHFGGLFMVLSDPVDPLCQAVYQASNEDAASKWDGMGLLPEQIQGFGLGVMHARAVACAKEFGCDPTAVRCFGPHGNGLVVANSLLAYDHDLSLHMTHWVTTANLRMRELGFKPYVAPALSSGAFQLLSTLRGQFHESSQCLGGIWMGGRNRFTPYGVALDTAPLPDSLYARLLETQTLLKEISEQ